MHHGPLDLSRLEAFLWKASLATLEDGGVTCNVLTHRFLPPIDAWGLPRYPEKTHILLPGSDVFAGLCCFVAAHANVLSAPDAWLGTWIHSETYCCHIDITEICSTFEEARTRASLRNTGSSRSILALYHFKHGQTLYLHDEVFSQGGSAHSECSDILPTTWAMRSPNGSSLSGSLVRSPGMGSRSERREVEG